MSARTLVLCALLGVATVSSRAQGDPGLTPVELTLVDAHATGYATFQSNNQKMVSNANGIFMAYIRSRNEAYTAQQWRLLHSIDNGQTFSVLHEAVHGTNPPVLETDAHGNLYLIRPDFNDGNAYLYRFSPEDGYASPRISPLAQGSAGKYAMAYDGVRQLLYYFAWGRTFYAIGLDGEVRVQRVLCTDGDHAGPQYPLFHLDRDGVLHTAWTTLKHGEYMYWDIHYMNSPDGGESWRRLDETPVDIPQPTDDTGITDRITLDDEFESHTWLSSFLVKDGKIHFVYLAQTTPWRQHYVRYDLPTARREIDTQPQFRGAEISLAGLDGYFAARADLPGGPLYCVHNIGGRLGCLASDDNGATWYDYAVGPPGFNPYAIGGCRELTADGYIIGAFTDYQVSSDGVDSSQVHFLKIRAGLSSAEIASIRFADGTLAVSFVEVRGQPELVRFHTTGWSPWVSFAPVLELPLESPPTRYQMKSRLGVESEVFTIDPPTAIGDQAGGTTPRDVHLEPIYPNPFNGSSVIRFSQPRGASVSLVVFDLLGRELTTLDEGWREPGIHEIHWDGRDQQGRQLPSSAYICRLNRLARCRSASC